jgi:HEAT repeat protein
MFTGGRAMDSLLDDLRRQIADHQVVVIAGAGVSIDSTDGAEVASWKGLLRHGIARCEQFANPLPPAGWGERQREALDGNDLQEWLGVAGQIEGKLGAPKGGEYARWLRETVGRLEVKKPDVLEALRELGAPIATTNYDGLIEEAIKDHPAITWLHGARVQRVLRGAEKAVLHLHGYWDQPESVVLGVRSYDRVISDANAQAVQSALALMKSFLFVGFGQGLADPNFGALLDWMRTVLAETEFRHFRLCRTGDLAAVQAQHRPEERVHAVPYGPAYSDLASFLRGLTVGPKSPAPSIKMEPYPGLRAFTIEEASIFFGRIGEANAILAQLQERPFLAVIGASGTGKSSLIRAGVTPRLCGARTEAERQWRALELTPGAAGENPFLIFAVRLENMLPASDRERPADIAQVLENTPTRLADYVTRVLAGPQAYGKLLLFVDQLEELFALVAQRHRGPFAELLAMAANDPRVRVVVTLRADFLPQSMALEALAKLLQAPAAIFPLGPPGPAALADMIRKPAESVGLGLEDGLADAILEDAGGNEGALPLVAFCLEELYRADKATRRLTIKTYREIGRLEGAISRRAATVTNQYQADLVTALPSLFRALVKVDAAGKATRQWAPHDQLTASANSLGRVVEALVSGRLLVVNRSGDQPLVALAHEALIGKWTNLRDWLKKARDGMQRLERLLSSLESPDPEDRGFAAKALAKLASKDSEIVSRLIGVLGISNEATRISAIDALGRIPDALVSALSDKDMNVRASAATALGKIKDKATEQALVTALDDAERSVRLAAAKALGDIGGTSREVAEALLVAAKSADRLLRLLAIESLAKISAANTDVVPTLLAGVEDSAWVRESIEALRATRPVVGETIPAPSIAALEDDVEGVHESAADALEVASPEALTAAIVDMRRPIRIRLALALTSIYPATVEAIPALVEALIQSDPINQVRAAEALGRMGPAAVAARGELVKALDNGFRKVREVALDALEKIGPGNERLSQT